MLVLSFYHHISNGGQHEEPIDLLIKPSWLSGLAAVLVSMALVLGAVLMMNYQSSPLKLLVDVSSEQRSAQSNGNYVSVDSSVQASNFVSNIPLFIFWAGVGIVAYTFTAAILNAIHNAAQLEEEMGYVHANRQSLIRLAVERLLIRLGTLIAWFIYLKITVDHIFPYAVALGYAGNAEARVLFAGFYMLAGIFVMLVCLHAHVVLLRLVALKPRLFG